MRATRYLLQLAYDIIRGSGEEAMEQMYVSHNDHPLRDFGRAPRRPPPMSNNNTDNTESNLDLMVCWSFFFRLTYPLTRYRYSSAHMSSSSAWQKKDRRVLAIRGRASKIHILVRTSRAMCAGIFGVETGECVWYEMGSHTAHASRAVAAGCI